MKNLFYLLLIPLFLVACDVPPEGNQESDGTVSNDSEVEMVPSLNVTNVEIDSSYLVKDAFPYTMRFEEQKYGNGVNIPALQSYVSAVTSDGDLLIMGGRGQGLHTFFESGSNFLDSMSNSFIFVIDPKTGDISSFDVTQLDSNLSQPLRATNAQATVDPNTGTLYIVGGYGWIADQTDMRTFGRMLTVNVDDLANMVKSGASPSEIQGAFSVIYDSRLAVTGGDIYYLNNTFYLVFGQKFNGQYRAFGGSDFKQKYTEEVRTFMISNGKLFRYQAYTNNEEDRPFHRRDGNIIESVDPATGKERIASYGGVFKPGQIAPYTYPVYINGPMQPTVDYNPQQKFSQYMCPVITVFDDAAEDPTVYHTFYGGIGHYYYFQTDSQKVVYDLATAQNRNDGFPFVADISTYSQSSSGVYTEMIYPYPTVDNRLIGSSIKFIYNPDLVEKGYAYSNNVTKLSQVPENGEILLGYIYGGIEAYNPLPDIPNTGTFVSNSIFKVYLSKEPSNALKASIGNEAVINKSSLKRK